MKQDIDFGIGVLVILTVLAFLIPGSARWSLLGILIVVVYSRFFPTKGEDEIVISEGSGGFID